MPTFGELVTLDAQSSRLIPLQTAATTVGAGAAVAVDGFNGVQNVEITETAGGTATLALQGSMDGTTWYAAGYQQIDGVTGPSRSVAPINVTADSAHVYEILDAYRYLRANITALAGAAVTARVYLLAI